MEGSSGMSSYLLVFTDRRLIVTLVGGCCGFINIIYKDSIIEKIKENRVEELLSNKNTYTILYDEISSIEVAKGGILKSGSIKVGKTVGEPEKFNIDTKKVMEKFGILSRVFGDRLIVKT